MQMNLPVELANGANATLTIKLAMSSRQRIYALEALGLSTEEITNALGQVFQEYATVLGANEDDTP